MKTHPPQTNAKHDWLHLQSQIQSMTVVVVFMFLCTNIKAQTGRQDFKMGANTYVATNPAMVGTFLDMNTHLAALKSSGMNCIRTSLSLTQLGQIADPGAKERFESLMSNCRAQGISISLYIQSLDSRYTTDYLWGWGDGNLPNFNRAYNAVYLFLAVYKNNADFLATIDAIECDNEMAFTALFDEPGRRYRPEDGQEKSHYHPIWIEEVCYYLKGMSQAIRDQMPAMKILINSYGECWAFFDFLNDYGVPFDIVGWHSYGKDEATFKAHINRIAIYNKPIWVNEFNSAVGPAVDDEVLRAYYTWMYNDSRIKAAYVFTLFDEAAAGFPNTGIYTVNTTTTPFTIAAKPACDLFYAEAIRRSGGIFNISSISDNKLMSVENAALYDGAPIHKLANFGSLSQIWYFVDIGNGWTEIVNRNSHKTLFVANIPPDNGDPLIQWQDIGGDGQYWQLVGDGNHNYKIKNKRSWMLVTAGATDGRSLIQWTPDPNLESIQKWNLSPIFSTGGVNYDIGTIAIKGTYSHNYGVHTIKGAGVASINAAADAFNFTCDRLSGNGSITAKVTSMTNTNPWARAGIMIRDGNAPNAKSAAMFITPSNGVNYQWRTNSSGNTRANYLRVPGMTAPYWLRLVRSGNIFTGYYSLDGSNWASFGSKNISMSNEVLVGMAVSGNAANTSCTATFEQITMTGTITELP